MKQKIYSSKVINILIGGLLILSGLFFIILQFKEQTKAPVEQTSLVMNGVISTSINNELTNKNNEKSENNITLKIGVITNEKVNQEKPHEAIPETELFLDTSINYIRSNDKPEYENPPIPDRIVIPTIDLDAPIISADFNHTDLDGETFGQWKAPSAFAAGWHPDSALLGEKGNTVINGHHNLHGDVFKDLVDLEIGDVVIIHSGDHAFSFTIANRMIVPERYADLETRVENALWLGKSDDVRLTLVTCWPENTNTHRLILVASPTEYDRTD